MDEAKKLILLIFVILYILSPIDACPGPIDDLLLVLFALASRKQLED